MLEQSTLLSRLTFGERAGRALAELALLPVELAMLLADPVFRGIDVPRGDGHPVLVVPGLGAGDDYLEPMRSWLRRIGYRAIRSRLIVNPGWSQRVVLHLGEVASEESERAGRPVTIIGHSLGGALARSVAIQSPSTVRHVIALGSPIQMLNPKVPATVRMSAVYTRSDSIVRYPHAVAPERHARNIEVTGTHSGLAMNRSVYRHLGELLADAACASL